MAEADQAQGETRVCPTCGSNDPTLCRNDDDHSPLNRGGSFGHPHGEYPAKCCPDPFHLLTSGRAGTERGNEDKGQNSPGAISPEVHESLRREVSRLRIDRARWRSACQAAYGMNRRARSVELGLNRWWRHFRYRMDERGWWRLPVLSTPVQEDSE